MFQSLVITLREGLEAFLIVAISLAYLRKSGRRGLVSAVHWGVTASVAMSLMAAWLFHRVANQALWEGVFAIVAAVLVASLTIHMWATGRQMKRRIQERLERSAGRYGAWAWIGVFVFVVFMITREGLETVLLFNALVFQVKSPDLLLGAALGCLGAALLAWGWAHWGHRLNLGLFLQVTAVFLLLFVGQLLIYGLHELTEARVLPYSETLHWATEPYGPDGVYGQTLSYLLVGLPVAWLGVAALRGRWAAPSARAGVHSQEPLETK